jgi:hypothetical protein
LVLGTVLQQKLEVAAVDSVALPDEADQGICISSATAILMTDFRSFGALSAGLSVQELIAFLGDYQSRLVPGDPAAWRQQCNRAGTLFSACSAREVRSSAHLHQLASAQMPFIIRGVDTNRLANPPGAAIRCRRIHCRDRPESTVFLAVGVGCKEQGIGTRWHRSPVAGSA